MIVKENNKINQQPYIRITSDKENHYVKIKGSNNEPTNEIMIKGTTTDLDFEEIYVEPQKEENEAVDIPNKYTYVESDENIKTEL